MNHPPIAMNGCQPASSSLKQPMELVSSRVAVSPLRLLMEVNSAQAWRRLKSIRQQSRLLTSVIFCFIVGYLGLSFWLFSIGLKFVASFPGLGGVLMERLIFLLFAFL